MRLHLGVIAVLIASAFAGNAAAQTATGKHAICAQINGPYAAYTSPLGHHLKGHRWTVFVNYGVPCSVAMKLAPKALAWWKTAEPGDGKELAGFLCSKDSDRAYSGSGISSGGVGCVNGVPGRYPKNANFQLRMTGPYTIAQLKKLLGG